MTPRVPEDEFKHEDMIVTGGGERQINPEKVRNVFLGLNDGLVEILGAVSGFFAAFGSSIAVLAAGFTVAVAGALSMAAVERESPWSSALVVGAGYLAGALVAVLPASWPRASGEWHFEHGV